MCFNNPNRTPRLRPVPDFNLPEVAGLQRPFGSDPSDLGAFPTYHPDVYNAFSTPGVVTDSASIQTLADGTVRDGRNPETAFIDDYVLEHPHGERFLLQRDVNVWFIVGGEDARYWAAEGCPVFDYQRQAKSRGEPRVLRARQCSEPWGSCVVRPRRWSAPF